MDLVTIRPEEFQKKTPIPDVIIEPKVVDNRVIGLLIFGRERRNYLSVDIDSYGGNLRLSREKPQKFWRLKLVLKALVEQHEFVIADQFATEEDARAKKSEIESHISGTYDVVVENYEV